jgi:hypothetical protein
MLVAAGLTRVHQTRRLLDWFGLCDNSSKHAQTNASHANMNNTYTNRHVHPLQEGLAVAAQAITCHEKGCKSQRTTRRLELSAPIKKARFAIQPRSVSKQKRAKNIAMLVSMFDHMNYAYVNLKLL